MRSDGRPTSQNASFWALGADLDRTQADPTQETISTFLELFMSERKVFGKVFRHQTPPHALLCSRNERQTRGECLYVRNISFAVDFRCEMDWWEVHIQNFRRLPGCDFPCFGGSSPDRAKKMAAKEVLVVKLLVRVDQAAIRKIPLRPCPCRGPWTGRREVQRPVGAQDTAGPWKKRLEKICYM